jgi:mono/diheme cytochrome c family protein
MRNPFLMACLFLLPVAAGDAPAKRNPAPGALPGDLLWMIGPRDGAPPGPSRRPARSCVNGGAIFTARPAPPVMAGAVTARVSSPIGSRPGPPIFAGGLQGAVHAVRHLPTDEDLFSTITRGMHGTSMRRWPQLRERDRWALVFHLKSLSPRFRVELPGRSIEVPIPPRQTESLRARGQEAYVRLQCESCHGSRGAGDGSRPDNLLAPSRKFNRGRFIRGAEVEHIYVTLRVGLEGTHMAPYESLGNEELWALAAYVRTLVRERPLHEIPLVDPELAARDGYGHRALAAL